ncbi:MAG TPA: GIY-YIG nuclease family protein [Microvirga sp.]|jgi:hypothetical protein|nr:GIY-YIG nuclease family protein [Microvirga sp.]
MPKADYVLLSDLCRRERVKHRLAKSLMAEHGIVGAVFEGDVTLTRAAAQRLLPLLVAAREARDRLSPARAAGRIRDMEFVYFIRCEGFVKIGRAFSPSARLRDFQVGSPFPLELLATEPGDDRREFALHHRFAEYRVRGEWFRLEGALLDYISGIREAESQENPTNGLSLDALRDAMERVSAAPTMTYEEG